VFLKVVGVAAGGRCFAVFYKPGGHCRQSTNFSNGPRISKIYHTKLHPTIFFALVFFVPKNSHCPHIGIIDYREFLSHELKEFPLNIVIFVLRLNTPEN
jgi:hypothetical protein